jgi:hypothetical protein
MKPSESVLKPSKKLAILKRKLRKAEKDGNISQDDKFVFKELTSRADRTLENFRTLLDKGAPCLCKRGLSIRLRITEEERQIAFSLDHFRKEDVIELIKNGELYEELLTLYQLALLPGTESFTLNVDWPGQSFDVIDRVYLYLEEAFHPCRQKKPVDILDVLAMHVPYKKDEKIEAGIRWLQERESRRVP